MQKNRIEIAGYLTAKPEVRRLPSGTKVANARLGETYRYAGADKQIHSQTNWHNLTFYAELADIAAGYDKGDNLFIEGTLQQRRFTPKDGVTRMRESRQQVEGLPHPSEGLAPQFNPCRIEVAKS